MIELRHLRTLRALREAGNLAGAADHLHVTQSALSHQIKELESQLEVTLFHRKSRPLRFTPAGERLLTLADCLLPEVEAAEQDIARIAGGRQGRLHIAIECHSCFEWLMPTLDAYRPRWPDVELDLSLAFNFEPLPALLRGDIDLVITSDPQDLDGVVYVPLFGYQGVLVLGKGHALLARRYIRPSDLAGETLITYPVPEARLDIYRHFLDPAGVRPAQRRSAELTVMLVQLVASGRGVAALPNWAVHEFLQRGEVEVRPLGRKGLWGVLYAAVRTGQQSAPFLQDFVEQARATSFHTLTGIRPCEAVG